MNILVDRKYKKDTYTIGDLYIDGTWFCNTIEDKDRGLKQNTPLDIIKKTKVQHETAIPTGTYKLTTAVVSPKYSKRATWKMYCGGRMPRILNVPGFDGVLIHTGNTAGDSSGCILVGLNRQKGRVLDSVATFKKLYPIIDQACKSGDVTITIK